MIRKLDIQRSVTERAAEASPYSVRRELGVIKHLFSLAVEWEIIPVSPAQRVKAPKMPAGQVRYLQPTELRALLEACPDGLRQIAALAVSTGMRRGEIMGLRYLDVDLANRRIMLPQTKNGECRVVYLNDLAASVFNSVGWPAETRPGDLIFSDWTRFLGPNWGPKWPKMGENVTVTLPRNFSLRTEATQAAELA